jgi:hypothetical protein
MTYKEELMIQLDVAKKCKTCGGPFAPIINLNRTIYLKDECAGCATLYQEEWPDSAKQKNNEESK